MVIRGIEIFFLVVTVPKVCQIWVEILEPQDTENSLLCSKTGIKVARGYALYVNFHTLLPLELAFQ